MQQLFKVKDYLTGVINYHFINKINFCFLNYLNLRLNDALDSIAPVPVIPCRNNVDGESLTKLARVFMYGDIWFSCSIRDTVASVEDL